MNKMILVVMLSIVSANTLAEFSCDESVDKLQLVYINGMFTDSSNFLFNGRALDKLQNRMLSGHIPKYAPVVGYRNRDESTVEQLTQVFLQKLEVAGKYSWKDLFWRFIHGDGVGAFEDEPFFLLWAEVVSEYYQLGDDVDYRAMTSRLSGQLSQCARTVLVTHSQGNFYGDGLFSEKVTGYLLGEYWPLAQYPMLGQMAVATPSYRVGGWDGDNHSELLGNVTNNTDLVMLGVRATVGALPPTYSASFNFDDWSGHGFYDSYLAQPGQSEAIAHRITEIALNMTPWPMHDQTAVSSSALDSFGYSEISQILDVEFTSGSIYRYYAVPKSVVDGLHLAESKGRYFYYNIRTDFEYERLN
ncbi:KTSC domain-containing protein [Ferrimonas gelatinilytica]|uniref:KTSC domain-containing protein n=1 Tax=Ferrimonas gelatinilytica TaxID=1255257 RepID=A0ABP9SCN1_9GAMM